MLLLSTSDFSFTFYGRHWQPRSKSWAMRRHGDEKNNDDWFPSGAELPGAPQRRLDTLHVLSPWGSAESCHGQSASVSYIRQKEQEDKRQNPENATRTPGKWKLVGCIKGCEHVFRYSSLFALFRGQRKKSFSKVCSGSVGSFSVLFHMSACGMTLRNFFLARKQLKSFLIRSGCPVQYHWGERRPQRR